MEYAQSKKELTDRLTAVWHVTQNHFSEHQKLEGYQAKEENADRLLKIDTLYGTMQLGYDSKKGKSFIFANIKTSIYDTASASYMKKLNEEQMAGYEKTETQNTAYTSKRRNDSAAVLYKAENKPWTRNSVKPYLNRVNMDSLRKTMPFLNERDEIRQLEKAKQTDKKLKLEVQKSTSSGKQQELFKLRTDQHSNLREQEYLNVVLYQKATQSNLFFKKINVAFDSQKQEIFEFYKTKRLKAILEAENEQPIEDEG